MREEVRVGGAEERAVRHTEVVEPRLAERLAEQIEIAGRVGGREVLEQAAAPSGADLSELAPLGDVGALLGSPARERAVLAEERVLRRLIREALDRGARPGLPSGPSSQCHSHGAVLREQAELCRDRLRAREARPSG